MYEAVATGEGAETTTPAQTQAIERSKAPEMLVSAESACGGRAVAWGVARAHDAPGEAIRGNHLMQLYIAAILAKAGQESNLQPAVLKFA